MCEFKVLLDGEEIMEDVIHAKVENGEATITDIIGETKTLKDVEIVEVNVPATRLVLKNR